MRPAALASLLLVLSNQLLAQTPGAPPASRPHRDSGERTATTTDRPASLPVTRVSLYKNGVGFFEHTGRVSGDAAVTIDFTDSQLNDVLQSLTAIDLNGGRIAGAGYNSTTPLDQQLQNLPLALGENPSATDLFSAIRGARVEVRSGTASITGRLMSIEVRSVPVKEGETSPATERRYLTVVSESGEIRTLELTPATSVHLLDSALHTDVNHYLQLIDATRNRGLRHLTLSDHGTGSRELRVSYISEVPIWKSTYRILFTDKPSYGEELGCKHSSSSKNGVNSVHIECVDGGPPSPEDVREMKQTATLQGWSVVASVRFTGRVGEPPQLP